MKTNIVQIGNSKGIRIPKNLLEQCHLKKQVELQPLEDGLFIRSLSKRRQGWEKAFKQMAENGDDLLLDKENLTASEWDHREWKW